MMKEWDPDDRKWCWMKREGDHAEYMVFHNAEPHRKRMKFWVLTTTRLLTLYSKMWINVLLLPCYTTILNQHVPLYLVYPVAPFWQEVDQCPHSWNNWRIVATFLYYLFVLSFLNRLLFMFSIFSFHEKSMILASDNEFRILLK